jgi:hypothetical protein
VKKRLHIPLILLAFFLLSWTLHNFSTTPAQLLDHKQSMIALEEDSGLVTVEKAEKKLPLVPDISIEHTEALIILLLLLVNCGTFILLLRRRLFTGPIFYQSNYVIHFF